ncbi:alpha/beta fold hydrolase [Kitasatospora aureofaciens]|uniref:alpha/beta fold hydrolase n=1 Tax=Kitasatospora aureofaciens TaxID=1894 RepID=UPI0037CC8312
MPEPITNDGVRLSYRDSGGDGVPLVLRHGWGSRRTCSATSTRRGVLDRIDVPTLVLGCEGSHVDPVSQRFIAERIPGARLPVFPASIAGSHFPFPENPRRVQRRRGGLPLLNAPRRRRRRH